MTAPEISLTWGEVVSTDYVWSTKRSAWFEVIEVWTVGGRTHFRLRGAVKPQDVPPTTPVRVRRSQMGAAVDLFVSIISSASNGYRDAGTDQMDPYIQRIRGIKRQADTRAESEGRPRTMWDDAKRIVLDEMHQQAIDEDGKR